MRDIQERQKRWAEKNFPGDRLKHFSPELIQGIPALVGLVEEVGELAHAHLKEGQQIRMNEHHEVKAMDAVGDIVIYLMDYCNMRGWDFQSIVEQVWEEVEERSWRNDD